MTRDPSGVAISYWIFRQVRPADAAQYNSSVILGACPATAKHFQDKNANALGDPPQLTSGTVKSHVV
jgi:hypothetical protein